MESKRLEDLYAEAEVSRIREDFSLGNSLTPEQGEFERVEEMETQIRELKHLLALRDHELTQIRVSLPRSQLHTELLILEEENRQLQSLSVLEPEIARLRVNLRQMNALKNYFEQLYRESALKFIAESHDISVLEDENELVELAGKLDRLTEENSELHLQVKMIEKRKQEIERERDYLQREVVPVLEMAVDTFRHKQIRLKQELEEARKLANPVVETPIEIGRVRSGSMNSHSGYSHRRTTSGFELSSMVRKGAMTNLSSTSRLSGIHSPRRKISYGL